MKYDWLYFNSFQGQRSTLFSLDDSYRRSWLLSMGSFDFFDMFHGQGSFFDTHEREGSIDLVVNATSLLNVPKTIFQSALAPY